MSLLAAFDIPVGSMRLTIPAGEQRVPGILWDDLALAALLDNKGYDQVARDTLSRLQAWLREPDPSTLAWPGDQVGRVGHKLLDGVEPGDAKLKWYVVRSATRREKDAEKSLIEAGMPVYVPRLIRSQRIGGRKRRVEQPLIPGYLFVGARPDGKPHDDDVQSILGMEGVHGFVRFSRDRSPVAARFGDLARILKQEQDGEFDRAGKAKREDPKRGDAVTIAGGKFQGFPAQFVKRRPNERIEVLMQMFGRWSSIVLLPEHVEGTAESDEARL